MKTLGLIGGTSWVSTVDYYRLINQTINEKLGNLNSGRLILYSVNFEEFKPPSNLSEWGPIRQSYIEISRKLIETGADCIMLCANTSHLIADDLQANISKPLLHIGEATAKQIVKEGIKKVGLLGTKITMQEDFFVKKLVAHGIETLIPGINDRDYINNSIFSELAKGVFKPGTKEKYIEVINEFKKKGVEAVIFACTEIPMLIKPEESPLHYFDTLRIHVDYVVDFALSNGTT